MKFIIVLIFLLTVPFFNIRAQNGLVKTYYSNGQTESEVFYVKDAIDGVAKWYYDNGVLKVEITYMLGKVNGWVKKYYENGAPKEEYYVNDGRLDGLYKTYFENGGIKSVLNYEDGLLKTQNYYAYDSTLAVPETPTIKKKEEVQVAQTTNQSRTDGKPSVNKKKLVDPPRKGLKEDKDEDLFFVAVEQEPEPIGGIKSIMDKIVYPPLAQQAKVEGEVVVRAYVDEEGNVTRTDIVKGLGLGCDEAAKKAVEETKFRPGTQRGKPVKVQVTIPIKFNLSKTQ